MTSRSGAGLPMYAIAAIACGVLVVAAVLSVLAGRRYCRSPRRGNRLDGDADSLVFFEQPDADPTLDLRIQSRAESRPARKAPRAPDGARQRPDSAELREFNLEQIADEDASETARLTGN